MEKCKQDTKKKTEIRNKYGIKKKEKERIIKNNKGQNEKKDIWGKNSMEKRGMNKGEKDAVHEKKGRNEGKKEVCS